MRGVAGIKLILWILVILRTVYGVMGLRGVGHFTFRACQKLIPSAFLSKVNITIFGQNSVPPFHSKVRKFALLFLLLYFFLNTS